MLTLYELRFESDDAGQSCLISGHNIVQHFVKQYWLKSQAVPFHEKRIHKLKYYCDKCISDGKNY